MGKLCEFLGASPEDCIAFGDANVGIPMFEACGASRCMDSDGDAAKEATSYVTHSLKEVRQSRRPVLGVI